VDKTILSIDVFSDVVCPWCFIGKHRLDAALASLREQDPQTTPQVRWLPYFLNPDTPVEGEPYRAFMEKKFGAEKLKQIQQNVAEAGRTAGIEFEFDKMLMRPNTLRAHRLINWVQQTRDAGALKERLMAGHFQRGENVGDLETLVRIAVECGQDEAAARAFLLSGERTDIVQEIAAGANQMGINGVPFFIFNQRVAMSGAHPPEDILQAIAKASVTH
jgi:predicted DsbA family dithiol-disulfide isomerase